MLERDVAVLVETGRPHPQAMIAPQQTAHELGRRFDVTDDERVEIEQGGVHDDRADDDGRHRRAVLDEHERSPAVDLGVLPVELAHVAGHALISRAMALTGESDLGFRRENLTVP